MNTNQQYYYIDENNRNDENIYKALNFACNVKNDEINRIIILIEKKDYKHNISDIFRNYDIYIKNNKLIYKNCNKKILVLSKKQYSPINNTDIIIAISLNSKDLFKLENKKNLIIAIPTLNEDIILWLETYGSKNLILNTNYKKNICVNNVVKNAFKDLNSKASFNTCHIHNSDVELAKPISVLYTSITTKLIVTVCFLF